MSSTVVMLLIGVPFGLLILSFLLMTVAAGFGGSAAKRRAAAARPAPALTPEAHQEVWELARSGKMIHAVKRIRQETGLGLKEAKDYAEAIRDGGAPPAAPGGLLSDRVRAFLHAGDRDAAVALVRAETGMGLAEAVRFVDALD
ncbi:MAG TPA: 50S ribosomal protein L7/L12 [Thermomonospora sp.]|nr:50S ribosomal protein L7/L12 [Thermomonospora sp.]